MTEKEIVDKFTSDVGIMVTWCEACKVWTVHCPECNNNHCGGWCGCGYVMMLNRQQDKLIELLEEAKA